jgi:hypothetical protein
MSPRKPLVAVFVSILTIFGAAAMATHTIEDPCAGQAVTVSSTDGNDSNLPETSCADVISTGSGDDDIYPAGGGDRVCAGDDNDFVADTGGADTSQGNDGADIALAVVER